MANYYTTTPKASGKRAQVLSEEKNKAGSLWLDFKIQTIILVLVSFLFYANTIDNGYAVDDGLVIEQNKYTQKGFRGNTGYIALR
jgi:hypothetical protein